MHQYTIIYKYGKRTRQLKIKKELKDFPQEKIAASENRFATQLNEKVVIELLENAAPGSTKKATRYGMKTFQGKNFKTLFNFDNLSIRVSQSKTMQAKTNYKLLS